MKRVAEPLPPSAAVTTNKRVKEKHHDIHVREPPEEEEETNGRHDEDLHVREPPEDEEETDDLHNEDEIVSDDHERSIATDPGQPLAANLPLHILETIFAHLSVQDIVNCSLVCARWSAICRREKFLFWKKSYLKVKREKKWEEWGRENGIAISHPATMECLKDITRFVQREFANNKLLVDGGDEERVSTALSHHPQYTNVVGVLQRDKVLQHCKDSTLPATVSLLVTLSRDVFEVRRVFLLLTAPGSPCCLMRVVELFYCLATFFYKRWRQQVLPQRYHYKVCHVLTLFEQPSVTAHREGVVSLTHEQSRIVNHPIKPGDVVKVVAFAGTGKTTTLLHFALAHPNHKFLYLVYNKSVQMAASKLFPRRVDCKTFHSFAHKYTGRPYNLDRSGTVSDLPEFFVEGYNLRKPDPGKMSAFELNLLANKAVGKFLASADEEIDSDHLPDLNYTKYHKIPDCIQKNWRELLVQQAKIIWKAMVGVNNKCPMTHDGYLKLFQLQRPRHQVTEYDCILIDESQDLSPAVLDILLHQTCPKIFVGDPHQQIYSFRGAVNAISLIKPTHSYYLTKSFRFGPNIAFLASVMLSELKSVHQQTLTGGLQDGGYYNMREEGQLAIVARTNGLLIDELFTVLQKSPKARLAFAGGVPKEKFRTLEDVYFLKEDQKPKIRSARIRKFKTFFDLKKNAEITEDFVLKQLINVCFKYKDIPRYIDLVDQNGILKCKDLSNADIVFTTAHSAKGLEFHTVKVADDYISEAYSGPVQNEFRPNRCAVDERNLLYVAITRATHYVIMSTAVMEVLQLAKEYPVLHCMPSSVAKSSDTCCNWRLCGLDNPDDVPQEPVIVPVKTRIPVHRLPVSHIKDNGPLCARCILEYYPELSPL